MRTFVTVMITVAYVMVGVRVTFVASAVEKRIGRDSVMGPIFLGAAWPAMVMLVGIAVVIGGDNGIYDSAFKYKGSQT